MFFPKISLNLAHNNGFIRGVGKKYLYLQTLLALSLLLSSLSLLQAATSDVLDIPMVFDNWQRYSLYEHGNYGDWEETSDDIKLYGFSYQNGSGMMSKDTFNFTDSQVFIKWQANGQTQASTFFPYLQSSSGSAILAERFTTQHAEGATVIADNTWYYSRITVNSDNTYTGVTAIDDYDINGGLSINTQSGTFDGAKEGYVAIHLADNDAGDSAYIMLGEVKIVANLDGAQNSYAYRKGTRRNSEIVFNYSVDLSWNDYQKMTLSDSVTADGSTSNCGHDADKNFSVTIPFQQDVVISRAVSGHCRSNITKFKYHYDSTDWTDFTGTLMLDYYEGILEFSLHARNDRSGGLFNLSCKSCTVSASATFFGETDTTPQQNNLGNYVGTIPYTQDKQELTRIAVPNESQFGADGMIRDIKCEATPDNPNVTVSCEQNGEEFIVYAYSNIMPPVASFEVSPARGVAPLTVTLDGSGSKDPVGNIVKYNWTASDGQSDSFSINESLTWNFNEGTHEICLVVIDDSDLDSDKVCKNVIVDRCEYSITPQSFAEFDSNGGDDSVSVQASDPECLWKIASNSDWFTVSTENYTGSNTVNFSVANNSNTERRCGILTIAEQPINICQKGNQPPTADFTYPQEGVRAPTTVTFTSTSEDVDGNISYLWESSGPFVAGADTKLAEIHFGQEGTYTVFLTVTDDDGATKSTSKSIRILPPLYKLTVKATTNGHVNVNDAGCGTPCVKEYVKGTPVKLNAIPSTGSIFTGWNDACSGTNPSCMVTMNQLQSVTASFVRCSYRINRNNYTYDEKNNNGSINIIAPTGCTWQAISNKDWLRITGNSNGNGNGVIKYSVEPNRNPIPRGERNGSITIAGQTTFNVKQAGNRTPTASFTFTTTSLSDEPISNKAPLKVQLDASASDDPTSNITKYEWTSSDNQTLSGIKPTITYENAGTYTISLEVFDEYSIESTNSMRESIFVGLPSYELSINSVGGVVKGNGIDCGSDCSQTYPKGSPVDLTAEANSNSVFVNWSGANCTGTTAEVCMISMDDNQTITANFRDCDYSIDHISSTYKADGSGNDNGTIKISVYQGCKWTAENKNNDDWLTINSGWSGNGDGTVTYSVSPNTNLDKREGTLTVVGKFFTVHQEGERPILTISKVGDGKGEVAAENGGIDCNEHCNEKSEEYEKDTVVTLIATPSENSLFDGWDGDCIGTDTTDTTCIIDMSQTKSVTATFISKYSLDVVIDGTGAGSVTMQKTAQETKNCNQSETCHSVHDKDTSVILRANPTEGSEFVGWNGDCSGLGNECTVSIDQVQKIVTATFNTLQQDSPEACFTFDYSEDTALTIDADASCSDSDERTIVGYQWQSGNDTKSGQQTSFTFDKPGKYILTLTVTDENGAKGTSTQTIIFNEQLVFAGLRPFYKVGEMVRVTLLENLEASNRFGRVDLWVAIQIPRKDEVRKDLQMPEGQDFLFKTPSPLAYGIESQAFKLSLEGKRDNRHIILEFEVLPGFGGNYSFYAAYVKEGKNPMSVDDGGFAAIKYLSPPATTVLYNY